MFLNQISKTILPKKIHFKIKFIYRKIRKFVLPRLNESAFRKLLNEKLKVTKGSVVFIHSSINNLSLSFPQEKILSIILDEIGENGTVLFPCTHINIRAQEYLKSGGIFNVKRSPTVMGLLPDMARRHKNSYRSLHPTHSVVAIGHKAKELTKNHHKSIYPFGNHSPYYKIVDYDAIIIGLGLNTGQCLSFVHCIEDKYGKDFPVKTYVDEIYEGLSIDYEGNKLFVKTLVPHPNPGRRKITKYIKKYIESKIGFDFKHKGVKYFTLDSKKLFLQMDILTKKGITIYNP
ncbi:MAG: AAC(3) family N-acetyltransferase [Bacteroidales bacterium]